MTRSRKQIRAETLATFEAVVAEYEAALLRYATRIVCDHDAAQDVVQNTFLKLFRHWKKELVVGPQISSWLYRVTHNCGVDYLRKCTRLRDLHEREAEERPDFALPDRGREYAHGDAVEKAAVALNALSVRERQLVILKIYEEKTYREISEIAGLTVGNVGYILHHAMRKMAAELRESKAI